MNLNVYNVFNGIAKATKLVTFPKIYLKTIWCDISLFINSDEAMAPITDRQISPNFAVLSEKLNFANFYIFKPFKFSFVVSRCFLANFNGS